jgi:diguanylate cyclase
MEPVSAASTGSPRRLPGRTLWRVIGIYVLAFTILALWLWQRWGGADAAGAAADVGSVVGALFAAGCAAWAARFAHGRLRHGWSAMAAGLFARAAGQVIWDHYELFRHGHLSYSPWASAFYLFSTCGTGAAVVLLSNFDSGRSRIRLMLDSAVVAGAMVLVSWVGVTHQVDRLAGNSHFAVAVTLAYPIADVVIITIAWASAVVAYRPSMALVVAGLVTVAVSDGVFAAMTEAATPETDNWVDLGWLAGCGVLGVAALRSIDESPGGQMRALRPASTRLWLPYVPLLAVVVVALMHFLPTLHSVPLAITLVVIAMTLITRQFVELADNQRLLSDIGQLAFMDQLTGVANRALFLDRVGAAVMRQRRQSISLAVLCLDLDDFKAVNDQLGHPAGDELLIRVAERLSVSVRTTDTLARFGGDEFAILIEGPIEDTVAVADRILAVFATPFTVDGVTLEVRPSVGLTLATAEMPQTTVDGLLRQADLAMYAAKRDGGGCLRSFVPDLPNPYELPPRSTAIFDAPATAADIDAADETDDGLPVQLAETGANQSRWPPVGIGIALAMIATGVVVFTLHCLFDTWPGRGVLHASWPASPLLLSAAAVVAARSWRVAAERWAWIFIAAGMAAAGVSGLVYFLWVPEGQIFSAADPMFLTFYPLVFTGLVLLLRQRLRRVPRAIRLDVAVVGLTVAAAATALALGPVNLDRTGLSTGVLVGFAYPVGGLLVLALSIGSLAIFGWRTDQRWVLLVAGFVLMTIASAVYLVEVVHGWYSSGTWLDACWPCAFLLIAVAAWTPRTDSGARPRTGRAPAHLPGACAVVAFGVIVSAHQHLLPVVLGSLSLTAIAVRMAVSFRDVSALAESHQEAMTDEVTGLANRLAVATALTAATFDEPTASRWDRRGARLGIVLVALDQFGEIADSLGQSVSGELLYRIGDRLSASVRPADLVARVGDDQFAVLLSQADLTSTRAQAGALMDVLRAPFELDHITVQVDASIGIALWPDHCAHPQDLLPCAETATTRARTTSSHIAVYDAGTGLDITNDGQLITDLRRMLTSGAGAPDAGELACYYQPKIRSVDDSVHSVEALVRWRHPARGLLLPDQFLPAAEYAGLMPPIAAQVLDLALTQLRSWHDQGVAMTVAVNLSTTNLLDLGLVGTIASLLRKHHLPASALIVEITESTLATDSQRARSTVAALRRLGTRLSLDDYGTGWSSLARLQDLSVDELKLDQVFVARLARDPRSIAIVRSTVALAHSLGAELVAEGVEDESTLFALRQYGCTITQGHVHCAPLSADEFERWLAARACTSGDSEPENSERKEELVSRNSTRSMQSGLPTQTEATDK